MITGTPSPHKHTWVSPDGQTRSQIDHVLTKREFKNSVTDTKVNVASDRYHVWSIKVTNKPKPKLDIHKLEWEDLMLWSESGLKLLIL